MTLPASAILAAPATRPPLDPGYVPAALANRAYRASVASAVRAGATPVHLLIALERENGLVDRHDLELLPDAANEEGNGATWTYAERHVKFLLWSRGGHCLHLHGPAAICNRFRTVFSLGGGRAFDADLMRQAYDHAFRVVVHGDASEVPESRQAALAVGGHLDGCRIGFDLGASDYKLAAVLDGEAVFSTEIPWDPVPQADPAYHYERLQEGLRLAASHLPRVDAIGGSAAGVYVANQVKLASLFRGVPRAAFDAQVRGMFTRLGEAWRVPLVVVNDGDVTALAGTMSLGSPNLLGIAMGSSEAGGFIDAEGHITGWLNELAFAPVDFNPVAPPDEWSGDNGVGALYFSQQAVNKLAPAAGFTFPAGMGLPERLKVVQAKANAGDAQALAVFESIGVYLGYSLAHYHDYYSFDHVLLLGRVTSGAGGDVILETGRRTLQTAFPDIHERIQVHVPDERTRRVGQAVAAASLPRIG